MLAIVLATRSDDKVRRAAEGGAERTLLAEHRDVSRDQLRTLFVPGAGDLPPSYTLTLHGPTPDGDLLVPLYPPALNRGDPAIFAPGRARQAWPGRTRSPSW